MSNATVSTTVTPDNLIARADVPVIQKSETVAISQTLARGAVVGKKTLGAVTAAAAGAGGGGANTGDGTCTALATLASPIPVVGVYTIKCVEAVTHGGVWAMYDPSGSQIAGNLRMTAGAGAATAFKAGGIAFTLTDGATDFAAADGFALTVAAGTGQVVACDKTAITGAQEPYGVMIQAVTTGSGATDVAPVAVTGVFNSDAVTLAGGTTVADISAAARRNGIFFVDAGF